MSYACTVSRRCHALVQRFVFLLLLCTQCPWRAPLIHGWAKPLSSLSEGVLGPVHVAKFTSCLGACLQDFNLNMAKTKPLPFLPLLARALNSPLLLTALASSLTGARLAPSTISCSSGHFLTAHTSGLASPFQSQQFPLGLRRPPPFSKLCLSCRSSLSATCFLKFFLLL